MNIENVFKKALEEKVIVSNNTENTTKMLKEADEALARAIGDENRTLKDKIINGQIEGSFISKATIVETYKGVKYSRPVIDLVQQGGGMYGIALLGYTYVMEKVGIRFYSHGGTSAGAINAMFLASLPNSIYEQESLFSEGANSRQASKSEILTHIIANTDFSSFMERKGIVGAMQRKLFKNFKSFWMKFCLALLVIAFLIFTYTIFGMVFSTSNGLTGRELRFYDFVVGTLNVFALLALGYILFVKLMNKNFGINTGRQFYTWANKLLAIVAIEDTANLMNRMKETTIEGADSSDSPRLVLITSNLTHNRIVKFPEKAGDYWKNPDRIKPGAYLRATMSLPFIYHAFIPSQYHYAGVAPENPIKLYARFVDGGMLSNFPIREFHRSDNRNPRFPTFGVLLSERELKKKSEISEVEKKIKDALDKLRFESVSLVAYIGSFFATFRNFYDNEFLFRNDEITSRIETVQTQGFNWLDFWMTDDTKRALFKKGVDAAIRQLDKFEWQEYLEIRNSALK